ncbi:MAG: thioredoxin family protein [Bacteroidales bacterium]|nr:thioredoxin family protein [Bacteroidales bacterium]
MKHLLIITILICALMSCTNEQTPRFMTPLDSLSFKEQIFDPDTTFIYQQKEPSVVYFYSNRVKNCAKQLPEIELAANVYSKSIHFYSVSYEENIKIAEALNIKKLPAFVFVPLNANIQTVAGGVLSYHDLEKAFDDIFGINK